jgi:hypothetical protein
MSSIRGREVARAQRSGVRLCEDALKALDFGNDLLGVHSASISSMAVAIVKRHGTSMSCPLERSAPSGSQRFLTSSALPKHPEAYHLTEEITSRMLRFKVF